ncbi:MAG TPA: carboxypeptidase-like regulatory domain-containing protein [Candidatus Thermoplasmatota archaeon]|nr:carboxypeptidase-like regulatory domain-containing protein [Candidatus Thermoplasmatota archaeon]
MLRTLALAICAATLLAGCGGAPPPHAQADDGPAGGTATGASVAAEGGIVRGLVVDPGVRPLAGVLVTTQAKTATLSANTSEVGEFSFTGLAPGTYFLRTHRSGYDDSQTRVEVLDLPGLPPVTRIQLVAAVIVKPKLEVYHFKGFLECSANVATPVTGGLFTPCEAPVTGTPVADEASHTVYNTTQGVRWVQTTMQWESSNPAGGEMLFNVFYNTKDYPTSILGSARGASPLVNDLNGTDADMVGDWRHLYFEAGVSRTSVQGVVGAAFEQEFDAFFVLCYGFEPPPGYLFWRDGEPKLPA